MSADEGEVVELHPPLPGLARSVRIAYRSGGMGRLKRSHPATRAEATHAEVTTTTAMGKELHEEMEVEAVDAFLREVEAFRGRVDARREEQEDRQVVRGEHLARRAEVQASFASPCARCGVDRERGDDRHVVVGAGPDRDPRTSTSTGFVSLPTVTYVEYVCPVCGSVEWFRRGHLDHPTPGT